MVQIYWTTFADSRLRRTRLRISRQAAAMKVFAACFPWDERDFDEEFLGRVGGFIASNPKGYGYWVWKPYILMRTLSLIPEGAFLLYTDAGCSLSRHGVPRLLDYLAMLESAGRDVLAFQMDLLPEGHWTKMDVCTRLGYTTPAELETGQCMATAMVIRNSTGGRGFVKRWASLVEGDTSLIDDTPSEIPNAPGFIQHRHDQSVFSILAKQLPAYIIPDETWWPGGVWRPEFPVHATRIKGVPVLPVRLARGCLRRIGQRLGSRQR